MEKVGANDSCPCGSGVKYKRCCGAKGGVKPEEKSMPWLVAAVVVAGVAAFAIWLNFGRKSNLNDTATAAPGEPARAVAASNAAPGSAAAAADPTAVPQSGAAVNPVTAGSVQGGPPYPQPAGAVPAGKVWSAEHGHWHNTQATAGGVTVQPMAQPMAQFPAASAKPIATADGKVWSEEHKHWHDVAKDGRISDVRVMGKPVSADGRVGVAPQPPGPVPAGKVWSAEHGHWHDVAKQGSTTTATAPAAPAAEAPAPKPDGGV
jgi:hypothetical protein